MLRLVHFSLVILLPSLSFAGLVFSEKRADPKSSRTKAGEKRAKARAESPAAPEASDEDAGRPLLAEDLQPAPGTAIPVEAPIETAVSDRVSSSSVKPVRRLPSPERVTLKRPTARELLARTEKNAGQRSVRILSDKRNQPSRNRSAKNRGAGAGSSAASADVIRASHSATQRLIAGELTRVQNDAELAKPDPRDSFSVAASSAVTPPSSVPEEIVTPQGKGSAKKRGAVKTERVYEDPRDPRGENEVNAAFPYTHLLPSPINLPGGSWKVGTTVAAGVTDFLEVSTNTVRDGFRMWNITAKVPLIEFPTFTAAAHVTFDSFSLRHFDDQNPDLRVNAWQPGITTGYEIADDMALYFGGNFNLANRKIPRVATSGYTRGARASLEWSYLYNPRTSRLKDNALSLGTDYDFSYRLWGVGVTHHWPTFELGLHYTVNADHYRLLPIFAFTTGFSF